MKAHLHNLLKGLMNLLMIFWCANKIANKESEIPV